MWLVDMDRLTDFDIPYEHQRIAVDDGVTLAVQTVGTGPAVLLANGIGVSYPGFSLMVEHLRRQHQVVLWDYRGIGRSALNNSTRIDFSMARQAADACAILDAMGIEQAAVLGWSMGVPVGLEMIRRAPAKVAAYGRRCSDFRRPYHCRLR